jgi:ABC-type glycerol-3-phosphate transport system permease component
MSSRASVLPLRRPPAGRIVSWAVLAVLAALMLVPFLWMVLTSLQPDSRAVLSRPLRLPWPPRLANYPLAWRTAPFGIYMFNSVFVASAATVLQLFTAMLCAYAFACLRFPGKGVLFILVLAVLMIPSQVAIVPLYTVISRLGWLDTYSGLVVPFAVDAFGIFLIRQNLLSIPKDYAEAARVEGAGHWRTAFSILAQLVRPSLIAYAIMAFKWRWNDYFWVLLVTSKVNRRTLPIGVVMMREVAEGGTQWHLLMAATMITILPLIMMYAVLQKYFTNEYLQGGLKS